LLGLWANETHALLRVRKVGTQRALEVSEQGGGGVETSYQVSATCKNKQLCTLAATNIEDAPRRHIWEVIQQLPGNDILADHLPQRVQPRSPLPFS
jgi:hypothetical protein